MEVSKNILPEPEGLNQPTKEEETKLPENNQENAVSQEEPVKEDAGESKERIEPKGSYTPETQLYSKLKDERRKRKELEEELRLLKESSQTSSEEEEFVTDTDKELHSVKKKLAEIEKKETMREIFSIHPQLTDKKDEFEDFLEEDENKNISLHRVAKLFLLEKNLLSEQRIERKGLESPTGGSKTPQPTGISEEDVRRIRLNEPKKYLKMIRDGKIKAEEII